MEAYGSRGPLNFGANCRCHLGPWDPSTVVPAVVAHQGLRGPTVRPHGLRRSRVLSVCSVSILKKWAKIPAISPGNFSEFATLPRKSEMIFFAGASQRL